MPRRYCGRAESGSTRAILGDRKWFRSEVTSPLPPLGAKAQQNRLHILRGSRSQKATPQDHGTENGPA